MRLAEGLKKLLLVPIWANRTVISLSPAWVRPLAAGVAFFIRVYKKAHVMRPTSGVSIANFKSRVIWPKKRTEKVLLSAIWLHNMSDRVVTFPI